MNMGVNRHAQDVGQREQTRRPQLSQQEGEAESQTRVELVDWEVSGSFLRHWKRELFSVLGSGRNPLLLDLFLRRSRSLEVSTICSAGHPAQSVSVYTCVHASWMWNKSRSSE